MVEGKPNNALRFGIIGFGGAGMALYKHLIELDRCEVCAVLDPHEEALARARSMDDRLRVYQDTASFLSSELDAVVVASPDRTHTEYIVKALESKKHVLCEKPLADSLDGCRQILKAEAAAKGCVAAVQHQMRFLPIHVRMKELLEARALGSISYVEGLYIHNLRERATRFHPWRFEDGATPLVYSGCHFVDLLRWLLDDEVEQVMAMSNNLAFPEYPGSDLDVLLMKFRSGVIGKVVTAFGLGRPQDHSVRIYGAKRSLENNLLFSEDGQFEVIDRPSLKRFTFYPKRKKERYSIFRNRLRSVVYGRIFERLLVRYRVGQGEYGVQGYPLRLYEHQHAVRASLIDFVHSIREGRTCLCRLEDAAQTVAVCLAGVESYRNEERVDMSSYRLSV